MNISALYFWADQYVLDLVGISDDLKLKAKRARNMNLDVNIARKLLNVKEGIEKMKTLKEEGFVEELKEGL